MSYFDGPKRTTSVMKVPVDESCLVDERVGRTEPRSLEGGFELRKAIVVDLTLLKLL